MREILLIWRAWLRGVKNAARTRGKRGGRAGLVGLAAVAIVGSLVFYGARGFLSYVQGNLRGLPDPGRVWHLFCLNLATSLSLASFLFLFMTAIGTVMATFLEGKGIEFLLSQPIRARSVFAAKLAESLIGTVGGLLPMILPAWLALGAANRAGPGFYAMVVLSFLGGGMLFLGPVVFLLLLTMRYVARQLVRQIAIGLSLLAGLVFVFGTQLANSLVAKAGLGTQPWLARLGLWRAAQASFLPHVWMARAPLAALGWPELSLAGTALPLLFAAVAICLTTIGLAERIFLAGWSSAQESAVETARVPRYLKRAGIWADRPGGPFLGILGKDFTLVRREPLLWYNIAVSVIVVGFFVWNVTAVGRRQGLPPAWLGTFYAGLIAVGTAGWNGQIGGVSLSREGANWWVLQAAPQRAEDVLAAKFAFAYLPQLAFVLLANLALTLFPMPGFSFWRSTLIGLALAAAIASLSLLLDVLAPNFQLKLDGKWSGGRNVGAGKVTLTTLLGLATVVVMGVSLALPAYYRILPFARWLTIDLARLAGVGVFLAETALALSVSWWLGVARVRKLMAGEG